jgi:hypothetical protein
MDEKIAGLEGKEKGMEERSRRWRWRERGYGT